MNQKLKRVILNNESVLFAILILLILFISVYNPRFFSAENAFDILRSSSFIGICSIGFLIVLISGGIDISFTATATVAEYFMALILTRNQGMPIILVLIIPMVIGIILGSFNAVLINKLKVPAIIITIAMLNTYYGGIQFISNGRWIYDFPEWFYTLPKVLVIKFVNSDGIPYGLSIFTVLWIFVALLGAFILNKTTLGRKIFAVGGSLESSRRAGINVNNIRIFVYGFLGFVAGLGAIVHALITQTVAPNSLIGQEFDVLSAVVIGGANIFGGEGTITGTILGVLLIAVLRNGLTIMKVPPYWHMVIIGFVIILSIAATATRSKISRMQEAGIDVE